MPYSELHFALHPRAVALIGASEREGSRGTLWWSALRRAGVRRLYAVNPKYKHLGDAPCYAGIKQVPGRVDLAVFALAPEKIPAVLPELAQKSVRYALIPPTDDLHASDRTWHLALLDAARKAGVRLFGPDSLGFLHPGEGLNLGLWEVLPPAGGITLLAQSGLLATAVMETLPETGAGFRTIVVTGLELDIDMPELVRHYADDPDTSVLALHVEALRNPRAFYTALRYAVRRKPVVVLRAGEDPRYLADRLASYKFHTVAGRDDVFDALLEHAGAHRVRDFSEFLAVVAAFESRRIPKRNRLGVISNSGAFAALAAGITYRSEVELPGFTPATVRTLQTIFPGTQLPVNPVDVGPQASADQVAESAATVLGDPEIDGLLVVLGPTLFTSAEETVSKLAAAAERTPKPVLLSYAGRRSALAVAEHLATLRQSRIVVLPSPTRAIQAFGTLARHRRRTIEEREAPPPGLDRLCVGALTTVRDMLQKALTAQRYLLAPQETEKLLVLAGIPVEASYRANDPEAAVTWRRHLASPVLMRRLGPELAPASTPTVRSDLRTDDEVREAWQRLGPVGDRFFEGVLVQRFHTYDAARSIRLALDTDSVLGPLLEVGRGGLAYECVPEIFVGLPPASRRDAVRLLRRAGLFDTTTVEELADMIERLSDLAEAIPAIRRIVLNPVVETADGVRVLEASVHLREGPLIADAKASHLTIATAGRDEFDWSTGDKVLSLRPLRENDFGRLEAFLDRLSETSKYLRFHTRAPITQAVVSELAQLNYDLESAWCLMENDEIRAVARWSASADGSSAEFGVIVEECLQRRGLASRLMKHIETEAFHRGIGRLTGLVLRENVAMNQLMTKLGYTPNESEEPDSLVWSKTLRYKDFS